MRRRGDDVLPSLDSVIVAANRARVSIYPIDPRATASAAGCDGSAGRADQARLREALRSLADGTSGRTISLGRNVAAGLKRAIDDRAATTSSRCRDRTRDGRFHAVEVSLRRPELIARARKGYWGLGRRRCLARVARRRQCFRLAPSRPPDEPADSSVVRHVSADRHDEVNFVWEPAPRVPGDRNPPPARAGRPLGDDLMEDRLSGRRAAVERVGRIRSRPSIARVVRDLVRTPGGADVHRGCDVAGASTAMSAISRWEDFPGR